MPDIPAHSSFPSKSKQAPHAEVSVQKPENHPITTTDDLWYIMSMQLDGSPSSHVEIRDLCVVVKSARETGLTTALRTSVPMRVMRENDWSSLELSARNVEYLCLAIVDEPDVEADVMLMELTRQCARRGSGSDKPASFSAKKLPYTSFRKVIDLISMVMQIDEDIIVPHLAWVVTGRFELGLTVAALAMQLGHARKLKDVEDARASLPDYSFLSKPFSARDFMTLTHAGARIGGQNGYEVISQDDATALFHRVKREMPQLKEMHLTRRLPSNGARLAALHRGAGRRLSLDVLAGEEAPPVTEFHGQEKCPPILGRTEFCILMDELFIFANSGTNGRCHDFGGSPLLMLLFILRA